MAQMTLDELVRQLTLAYGNGLQCVVLYGSAARGEHVAKRSDLNVLVVVDRITMEHLRQESAVARSWREAGNPPPLTLTLAEWRSSADIFPIEYSDILAHHRVLHGALPLDGIRVERRDLRLQLEHEAMSKLLRLRHAILSAGGDASALRDLMAASVGSILVLLRATLWLMGEEPPADSPSMLNRAGARTGIDLEPIRRVTERGRGEGREPLDTSAVLGLVEQYLGGVAGLVEFLDRFEGET